MPSLVQTGKTLRFLPPNSTSINSSNQTNQLVRNIGILEQAKQFRFTYEVEWSNHGVSIDYYCIGKAWTKGQQDRRKQEGVTTLELFLESLGALKGFQTSLEDRYRLLEVVKKSPFMLKYDDGTPFWTKPLQITAIVGYPSSKRPVIDLKTGNSLTDLVLQCFNDPPLHYGYFQIIFQGCEPPPSRQSNTPHENKKKLQSLQEQFEQQEEKDYWQIGSFVGEVRILLMDFERTRLHQAQTALTSLFRHYGLKTSYYPCWYRGKRISSVLTAIRLRKALKWQFLTGKRLAQFLRLPVRHYPGLQRLSPHLLNFKPPPTSRDGVIMGKPVIEGKESHESYYLSLTDLSNHLGVWGATGMGKSRFVYGLIQSLVHQGHSITILDPKGEYIDLATDLENIIVLRPGSTDLPFHLNILEVPPNLTEEDHLGFLHSAIQNIFLAQDIHMQPQMGAVLMQALRYAISNRLTFGELLNILEWPENKLITHLGVRGTNLEASAHAVANRLRGLTFGICRKVFLGETTIAIEKLLNQCCVIDLSIFENIESVQARKIFLEVFSHYLLNHLRTHLPSTHEPGQIEHILVIEEAQKLVPQKLRSMYSDEQSLLGKLPWTFRGYGVAVIYCGTEPVVETPILNNTGMTVMFHSKYRPDVLANLLGIRTNEYLGYREAQSLLGPSQYALISQKGQDGVFMLKVKDVPKNVISPLRLQKLKEQLFQRNQDQHQSNETTNIKFQDPRSEVPKPDLVSAVSMLSSPPLSAQSSTIQSSRSLSNHKTSHLTPHIAVSNQNSLLLKDLEENSKINNTDNPSQKVLGGNIKPDTNKSVPPGEFWFGKRELESSKSQIEEKSTEEIVDIWYETVAAYEVGDEDRFFRKLGISIEQAIKFKHQEVFGNPPLNMKLGMKNLRKEGWIDERQWNLEWLWDVRNEFVHTGVDLSLEELNRARQIGEKIIRGCLVKNP
ncbi:MAG: ATP-binding protein [Candidatus Hermodarchaeota archaeon]